MKPRDRYGDEIHPRDVLPLDDHMHIHLPCPNCSAPMEDVGGCWHRWPVCVRCCPTEHGGNAA